MAKTYKKYYYVLVFTNNGPVYVTDIPNRTWAEYDKDKKPMIFSTKSYAEEVTMGLNLNMHNAVTVESPYEREQPYRYEEFDCVFVKKERNDNGKSEPK